MDKNLLENKLAELEFFNDQLVTELGYVDNLLRSVGFSHGLESVKGVACELIKEMAEQQEES